MTLWQKLRNWIWGEPAVEKVVERYNPLATKVGSTLTVDNLELRKYTMVVQEIREYNVDYGNKSFHFADYECKSTLHEGDPVNVKVRVYPHGSPGRDLQILVLSKWDELDHDEEFAILLEDNQFNTVVDDETEASFWRINDVKKPYKASVTELEKENPVTLETWYWDYWRDTKDEGGTDYKEFLFVEWDKNDTGRYTIWRGEEVTQSKILI